MQNSSKKPLIVAVVVVIVIVLVAVLGGGRSSTTSSLSSTTSLTTADPVTYSLITSKSSYGQNEKIGMVISISNNTDQPKTFSFKDGCQASYKIGDFDISKHIRCLPEPSSFTVEPHKTFQIGAVHYPSVYLLPVGQFDLVAEVIGYSKINSTITITK